MHAYPPPSLTCCVLGTFNSISKITKDVAEVWSRILKQVCRAMAAGTLVEQYFASHLIPRRSGGACLWLSLDFWGLVKLPRGVLSHLHIGAVLTVVQFSFPEEFQLPPRVANIQNAAGGTLPMDVWTWQGENRQLNATRPCNGCWNQHFVHCSSNEDCCKQPTSTRLPDVTGNGQEAPQCQTAPYWWWITVTVINGSKMCCCPIGLLPFLLWTYGWPKGVKHSPNGLDDCISTDPLPS